MNHRRYLGTMSNYALRANSYKIVTDRRNSSGISGKTKFSAFKRDEHARGAVRMNEIVAHYQREHSSAVKDWIGEDSGPEGEKLEVASAALAISKTALKMGVVAGELGMSVETICKNIEKAAGKICAESRGYESPENAVLALILKSNEPVVAIRILERINSDMKSKTIDNVISILGEVDRLGFDRKDVAIKDVLDVASRIENMRVDTVIISIVKESNCREKALEILREKVVPNASEKQIASLTKYVKVFGAIKDKHIEKLEEALRKKAA